MNTISELIEWGTLELGTSAQAPFEAKMLLANSIQCDESFLFNNPDAIVSNENIETYQNFIVTICKIFVVDVSRKCDGYDFFP